jgi:hypothetical protein
MNQPECLITKEIGRDLKKCKFGQQRILTPAANPVNFADRQRRHG